MIRRTETASITFFIDGKKYAYRSWPFVPRRGDEIMLYVEAEDRKMPFIVKRVVWGVEGPDGHDLDQQAVNIDLDPAPQF